MSNVIAMSALKRDNAGTGAARALRREGRTPAVIYGGGQQEVRISMETKNIEAYIKRAGFMSSLFDIEVDGKSYRALPKFLQLHPVTDVVEHIDFVHVDKNAMIRVKVRIHVIGQEKSVGIKRGGILNVVNREIEVECRPDDIPSQIDVSISKLAIGDNVHLKDLVLPANVKATADEKLTVLTIAGRASEDDEKSGEAGEASATAEPAKKES